MFRVFLTIYLNFQELPGNCCPINDHNAEQSSSNRRKSKVNITFGKNKRPLEGPEYLNNTVQNPMFDLNISPNLNPNVEYTLATC